MTPEDNPVLEEAAPALPAMPVGVQLRAAREAHGYSVADIAQALKFSPRQIEALEQDDFSLLKGNTFLRGFVRSYARFLRLDENVLLDALQQESPMPVQEVRAVESMGAEMPDHISSVVPHRVRSALLGMFFLLGLMLLAAYAYWAGWLVLPELEVPARAPAARSDASEQPDLPLVVPPAMQVVPEVVGSEVVAVPVPPAVPVSPDDRQLQFSFAGDSWVEVRDARQTVVLTGKFPAASRQFARGKPPFQVVVGNAQSVKLHYEDRLIDLQPFTRAEVARLTLDDNSK